MRKTKKIRKIFIFLGALDIILIIITPFLKFTFLSFSEEFSEAGLTAFLIILIALLFRFYLKDIDNYKHQQENLEERLRDTFKYIGSINLQLEEMKKVFSNFNKYPENKKDVQALFIHTAERILGIINADWVLLRIVDINNGGTLYEYFCSRGNKKVERIKLDNRALLDGVCSFGSCSIVKSNQDNFNIKAYCVLPVESDNSNQEFLINSIVNQLEMFFIIFNSLYYKRNNNRKII
ncbi:MAG: hypothetical protein WCK59_00425 [Candidatus Falkowbacteria bacterium]